MIHVSVNLPMIAGEVIAWNSTGGGGGGDRRFVYKILSNLLLRKNNFYQ